MRVAVDRRYGAKLGRLIIVLALLPILFVGNTSGATAQSQPEYAILSNDTSCDNRSWNYSFHDLYISGDKTWPAWKRTRVSDSIANLSDPVTTDGAGLVSLNNVGNNNFSANMILSLISTTGSTRAKFTCATTNLAVIWFSTTSCNTSKCMWHEGHHEIMHALAAEHGGRYDSYNRATPDSPQPTRMATCLSASLFANNASLTPDDIAFLNWRWGGNSNWRPMNADSGFENNYGVWEQVGTGFNVLTSPSYAYGSRYAKWTIPANSSSHYAQQKVGVLTRLRAGPHRGTARVRQLSSGYSTQARIEIIVRTITFSGNNSCPYRNGLSSTNPNATPSNQTIGPWIVKASAAKGALSGTGWNLLKTPEFTINKWVHSHDFAVRLRGVSKYGSSPRPWSFDNLQVESAAVN